MSELEQAMQEALKSQYEKMQLKTICWGVVTEIKDTVCNVERKQDSPLHGVLLDATDDDLQSHITVYPQIGSKVLIGILENINTQAVILKCSEIEKVKIRIGDQSLVMDKNGVVFNEGKNNGLVKIKEMVDWMQKLHRDLQTLQLQLSSHTVAGNGSPLGLPFNLNVPSPTVELFENKNIKQ